MERILINKLVLAVLAILLLLNTKTVLGSKPTTRFREEMRTQMGYYKMMIMSHQLYKQEEKGLQCVDQGAYCNPWFGPDCCTNYLACVPWGIVGGVCVA
ncbi:unnamed protein product [Amaranthus hypochondriacus]